MDKCSTTMPFAGLSRLLLASAAVLILTGCESASPPVPQVRIRGETWTVELALTEREQQEGLSGRDTLDVKKGMLFVYPRAKNLIFCMRRCNIPIDIVFVGADLRVVNTYEMQVEPDRAGRVSYSSNLPARYALELIGGTLKRLGVRVGDRVEFFGIPNSPTAEFRK